MSNHHVNGSDSSATAVASYAAMGALVGASAAPRPVDAGLRFAFNHKWLLLCLCLVPAVVEAAAAYLHYSTPLEPQQLFLVIVFTLGANAWLLSAVMMACIESMQGKQPVAAILSRKALRFLPKVFFSYISLLSLVFCSALMLPLIFLVLFFIWAPAFCVGELYVPQEEREDEEEDLDDDEFFVRRGRLEREVGFFKNKSALELGFARSLQFGSRHAGTTLQVVILIWFANVVPSAAVDLLSSAYLGFTPVLLKIFLSSYSDVLATAVAAGAFLMLLPREARAEIGIEGGEAGEAVRPSLGGVRLDGKKRVFAAIALCAAGATYLVFQEALRDQAMPAEVAPEVRDAGRLHEQFRVEVTMTDPNRAFRWLEPLNFRLSFPELLKAQEQVTNTETEDETEPDPFIEPTRIVPLDATGVEIEKSPFIPYYQPLTLQLYFAVPQQLPDRGTYVLSYSTYFGEPQEVHRGTYGE
ncbi:MAG: hypothetical protein KDD69_09320 [Bdellovibrionales bacterium]|nr:hypothetical protein [Bdellovibrionales bacterium]